jgi:hypothetical protein
MAHGRAVPGRRVPWHGGVVAWLGAELGDGGVVNSEESCGARRTSCTKEKNEETGSGVEEEEEHATVVLVRDDGGAALLTRELQKTTMAWWLERSEARWRLNASSGHGEAAGDLGDRSSSSASRGIVAMEEWDTVGVLYYLDFIMGLTEEDDLLWYQSWCRDFNFLVTSFARCNNSHQPCYFTEYIYDLSTRPWLTYRRKYRKRNIKL